MSKTMTAPAAPAAASSLHVDRAELRHRCRSSHYRWRDPRDGPQEDSDRPGRAAELRPGVPEHGVLPQRHHVHRRRQGHSALPRLPDRAARGARRASSRSRGCCATASSRRRASTTRGCTTSRIHTYVHENVKTFLQGFRYDAHPMSMLCSTVAALSSFYPSAKNIHDPEERNLAIIRLIAKLPTLAAFAYRHIEGAAVRLSGQRSLVRRELPVDGRADDGAAIRSPSRVHARHSRSSSFCTPITSRTAPRTPCAPWDPHTSIRSRPSRPASRRSTGRCTAARTRRCSG